LCDRQEQKVYIGSACYVQQFLHAQRQLSTQTESFQFREQINDGAYIEKKGNLNTKLTSENTNPLTEEGLGADDREKGNFNTKLTSENTDLSTEESSPFPKGKIPTPFSKSKFDETEIQKLILSGEWQVRVEQVHLYEMLKSQQLANWLQYSVNSELITRYSTHARQGDYRAIFHLQKRLKPKQQSSING
jgi:hypothetical protein